MTKIRQIDWIEGKYGFTYGILRESRFFSLYWSGDKKPYVLETTLPGLKNTINVESLEDGKKLAQYLLEYFVTRICMDDSTDEKVSQEISRSDPGR